ncbi:MAG: alpha-glucan family phosphorylase, partial [Actinomycetes bacterium]
GAVGPERLAELAADRRFGRRLSDAVEELHEYLTGDRWYQQLATRADSPLPGSIAYFSPEFGITAALPQYSGGLGILAGDHLKSASDLGVPVIGVGLLYTYGYFRQSLSREGWQIERYPVLDPYGLALTLLHEPDGTPTCIGIGLPEGRRMCAHVWVAQVGRVPLLLLDADVEGNEPEERSITDRLYGGATDHRLAQELLLGIGGVRALRAYSRLTGRVAPEVYHTNEGHAGFLGVERIRELMTDAGLSFDEAVVATRAGTVFTTHTPVAAGIDRFPVDLVAAHFDTRTGTGGGDAPVPEVPVDRVLALGAESYSGGDPAVFNMAVMGLRLAQRANGVSRLHGQVSRRMFAGLWAGIDVEEIPITSITNGVHAPTWVAPEVVAVLQGAPGEAGADGSAGVQGDARLDQLPDVELWALRRTLRAQLVSEARRRVRDSWLERGASPAELTWVDNVLDPDVLTMGFARRVPAYKRLTLMLRDPDRLRALLLHPQRPVQIIVAGKSHPADDMGKALVQQMVLFADDPAVRHRIVFLPNYDMAMAQRLYPGVDVWLNNPLRPLEACGTSGMKAALNGGLNLSILDGWWDEMYDGENGWAIPTADGVDDPERRDDIEARAFYDLVETEVAPRFYESVPDGLPHHWIASVRHTLRALGPAVQATRMVREYVERLYLPAASSFRALDGPGYAGARELAAFTGRVRAGWDQVQVEHVETTGIGDSPQVGDVLQVRAVVRLGALAPADVAVQVVHGQVDAEDRLSGTALLQLREAARTSQDSYRYEGAVTLARAGAFGYTVRVLPVHRLAASPVELGLVATA